MAQRGTTWSRWVARATETLLPSSFVRDMRATREWRRWIESLSPELFDDLSAAPGDVKRRLFRDNVRLVEIETHARCNRICKFCPNVIMDRRKNRTETSTEILVRIFEQLGEIDYRGQIKVARYSEPLANPELLLEHLATARRLVPNAQLAVVTNTDYLKPELLDRLRDVGLDVLFMSLYLKNAETWSMELAQSYHDALAERLGLRLRRREGSQEGLICWYEDESLELRAACMNFDSFGVDRGATLERYAEEQRVGSCREPFETFVVDYTGAVVPCCNIRSDLPAHEGLDVGDLGDPTVSIFDVYAGRLAGWRRSMVGMGRKDHPCATCRHREMPGGSAEALGEQLTRKLSAIGRPDLAAEEPAGNA